MSCVNICSFISQTVAVSAHDNNEMIVVQMFSRVVTRNAGSQFAVRVRKLILTYYSQPYYHNMVLLHLSKATSVVLYGLVAAAIALLA